MMLVLPTVPTARADPASGAGPIPVELAWANDEVWEFLVVGKFPIPSNHHSHRPLYAIAPVVGGSHSPQAPEGTDPGVGSHDHVFDPPPNAHGTYNANWHVYALVPNFPGGEDGVPGGEAVPDVNVLIGFVPLDPDEFGFPGFPSPYAADLDGDGTIECDPAGDPSTLEECLTSVEKVHRAMELELAAGFDTGIEFVCPVRPH